MPDPDPLKLGFDAAAGYQEAIDRYRATHPMVTPPPGVPFDTSGRVLQEPPRSVTLPGTSMGGPQGYQFVVHPIGQQQPIDQTQRAVAAAMQFQAQRGYRQDLANGMDAGKAILKWGPMMFGPYGAAAAYRAAESKPSPTFHPAAGAAPAYFEVPGQRPTLVPGATVAKPGRNITPVMWTDPRTGKQIPINPQTGARIAEPRNIKPKITIATDEGEVSGEIDDPAIQAILQKTGRTNLLSQPSQPPIQAPAPRPQSETSAPTGEFQEGQVVRNRRTGKLYRVQMMNGRLEPVAIDGG